MPKLIILLSTGYAILMLLHWPLGFTFFTQLSNLYVAVIVLLQMITTKKLFVWKYTAVVSIMITFLVYLFVLAPVIPGGIIAAYAQDHWASLCLHVITPLASLVDFALNDAPEGTLRSKHIILCTLPPLIWYIFILALGRMGIRWHGTVAPYPFLNYEAAAGWFGWNLRVDGDGSVGIGVAYALILMLGLVLGVGFALYEAARRLKGK